MSKDNAGQVLFQVMEHFRSTSLSVDESKLLAFQLLTWAHLSAKDRGAVERSEETVLATRRARNGVFQCQSIRRAGE